MRPRELVEFLSVTIPAKLPVLIVGPPGVGKTEIGKQVAQACGADFYVSHPVVKQPIDFSGLPGFVNGEAEFRPFGDLRLWMNAPRSTVVLLDDLGQALPAVQAAAMQLLLAGEINGQKISPNVVFLGATNKKEPGMGVTGILEPVKSRFYIAELKPNVEDWCVWALANGVPIELVAFIRYRPDLLFDSKPGTAEIVNRPSPRTVYNMGRLYSQYLLKGLVPSVEALSSAAGQGIAAEFVGFIRIWQSLPNLDEILRSPSTAPVPPDSEVSALYAVATGLASKANAKNARAIMIYAQRLPADFGALMVRDAIRHCPAVAVDQAFVQWAVAHPEVRGG